MLCFILRISRILASASSTAFLIDQFRPMYGMLCYSGTSCFIAGVDIVAASWINFVIYSTASSSSCFSFSLIFRQSFQRCMFEIGPSWCVYCCLDGVFFRVIFVLLAIVTALWSDSRSTLDSIVVCKANMSFVMANSGILLASIGQ
jgi:hypothetical protein